ncbi:unnamed protein product [Lepeophtheirus salmonis]|uniref:(salmon louse) hypothetical protein n=1 Tax=Lepeophtheirus salmonis TaxID=72036 RepID=A0A7R8H564_LEPSM|nr:unnamed protein product [Lepeophtheirus salmonis]CAF2870967.1 unnamed protein product [Lepeophtheirus salmonis]
MSESTAGNQVTCSAQDKKGVLEDVKRFYTEKMSLFTSGASIMSSDDDSSSMLSETRYSDRPDSLLEELREMKDEIKHLRSQIVPLGKERSYFNVILATQEENIRLKAKNKGFGGEWERELLFLM